MFKKVLGMFSNDLAIDLGTANYACFGKGVKVSPSMSHLLWQYSMISMEERRF